MKDRVDRLVVIVRLGYVRNVLLITALVFLCGAIFVLGTGIANPKVAAWQYEQVAATGILSRLSWPQLKFAGLLVLLALGVEVVRGVLNARLSRSIEGEK